MKFPYLDVIRTQENISSTFMGLNQNIVVNDGEFAKMKNVSDRYYPAIAARENRGVLGSLLSKPNGIMAREHLFYVDGTACYYNGSVISGLTVTDGEKQLVNMGAYIVIFPDKKMYNTVTGAVTALEAAISNSGSMTFAPLSTGSAFIKITYSGINSLFDVNDGVEISGCTYTGYEINGTHVITDKGTDYIVIVGSMSGSHSQSGVTIKRSCPDMDYVCELDNRLWGCKYGSVNGQVVNEIYACAPGNPKNWKNFEATSGSSYAASVGSDGPFTGCISHMGYVLFFKENTIHMMYGNKPSNFSLNTKTLPGVRVGCEKSLCIVDQTLFYVGRNGVYAYDGATPTKISANIVQAITGAVASQYDDKYYLSCVLGSQQTILSYDPKHGIWDQENDDKFKYASYSNGVLHYVDKNNYLTTIAGNRDEVIEWMIESGDVVESSLDEKYISKIKLNLMLDNGSEAKLFLQYDDDPLWHQKGFVHSTKNKTYTFPVIPKRCNKFRYKLEGKGHFKLLGLARSVEGGSELNGSIQFGFRR